MLIFDANPNYVEHRSDPPIQIGHRTKST